MHVDRGGAPGEVRARHGERAALFEEFERDAVGGHAHRDGAAGVAEIPRERGLSGQHDRQAARPEGLDETLDGLGYLGDERAHGREARDEHGRRRLAPAALRGEQTRDGRRAERVGADAVDGVGRQHDELASGDGLPCPAHSGQQLLGVAAVEELRHIRSSLRRRVRDAERWWRGRAS